MDTGGLFTEHATMLRFAWGSGLPSMESFFQSRIGELRSCFILATVPGKWYRITNAEIIIKLILVNSPLYYRDTVDMDSTRLLGRCSYRRC